MQPSRSAANTGHHHTGFLLIRDASCHSEGSIHAYLQPVDAAPTDDRHSPRTQTFPHRDGGNHHHVRQCRPARRRKPASPRPTSRPDRAAAAPRSRPCAATGDRARRPAVPRPPPAPDRRRRVASSMPAARAAFRASTALIAAPSSPASCFFRRRLGREICVRTVRTVPALVFKGLARTVGPLPSPLPSASSATVRRSGAAKPLAGLDFGMGADDADGADGCAPAFSGAEMAGSW